MTSLSHRRLMAVALTTAFLGFSGTSMAQVNAATATPAAVQGDAHTARHDAKRAERVAKVQTRINARMAVLKTELQITAAQEPAWNAFIARMVPDMPPARQGGRERWALLTTPQRLDAMAVWKTERDGRMVQRHDAIKRFYALLNVKQQKIFDARDIAGFQRAGMRGHRGHHVGGQHRMSGAL